MVASLIMPNIIYILLLLFLTCDPANSWRRSHRIFLPELLTATDLLFWAEGKFQCQFLYFFDCDSVIK
jgi:hypothetical protein